MNLPKNIFRAYDIRGIYPSELNEDMALHIGKAIGTLTRRKLHKESFTVVIGHDTRTSSPALNKKLIEGLVSTGAQVTDTGLSLTPVIHFLTCSQEFDVGIEITASHNAGEYNGFRLDFKNAVAFDSDEILSLYDLVAREDYDTGQGSVEERDLNEDYVNYIKRSFSFESKFKVVIDCGFGTASAFAERIFSNLGMDIEPIYCAIDNTFPLGVPNPEEPEYMVSLKDAVLSQKADLGVTFDEDSDRAGFVDEHGNFYENDLILLLFAREFLKTNPGKKIIYDVKSTKLLEDLVTEWGGVPKMIRTGHTFFVTEVRDAGSIGGEFSGHMYFADRNYGYDDGIYTALRLIELMEQKNKKLHALMKEFPKRVHTPEIKVPIDDVKKFEVVEAVRNELLNDKHKFKKIDLVDGIRVAVSDTGWFLIRSSNTTPYLSIRAEGKSKHEVSALLTTVAAYLHKVNVEVNV